jgi:hypothetical protein
MSYNDVLSINGNTITIQNINTNDVWNIIVIDANFMLSKYNGRGLDNISIIPFPNIGDGLYGDIVLSVNNNPCFKGCIRNYDEESNGSHFIVSPKYVTLHNSGDTYNINVSSDCSGFTVNKNTNLISTPSSGTDSFTITSSTSGSIDNVEIIVTNNCNGLQEIVYVSQKPSQDDPKLLTVNPQYITLSGDDKEFKINVISMCNGSTDYNEPPVVEGITLNKNGNFIYGTITSTENIDGRTFTVSNDCVSKTVTVNYSKIDESSHYMWIKESGTTSVTSTSSVTSVFDSVDKELICEIDSSSNWYIYSYDSTKVKCSKTVIEGNSNCIKITLGEDKSKCDDYEIILRNRDNDEVKVIYSIVDGLVSESGVTFTFETGNTVHETGTITQNSSTDDITFDICVLCYDSDNKPVNWSVKSSAFITTETDLKGGVSGSCKTVTLKATESTKKSKSTNYTIKLQEQETFKELTVKVVIDRPESETNSSYHIEMYPEDGSTYSMSEMNDFQISVTPSYIYNGSTYYIGNNDAMSSNSSYKGVSAKTESKTSGVILSLINESDVYDTLIYKVNITDTELESFEVCSTAYTKDNEATETTVCSTINLTAHTVDVICDFTTGETTIEVSGGAQTFEVLLMSRKDGEVVPLKYSGVPDWITVRQDEYGEKIFLTFTENSDFNERRTGITVTQDGGCDEGNYKINIVQYSNQTIFIPDFDYIVVRYFWEPAAGVDLDTVTVIPYLINNDGTTNTDISKYPYIEKGVGWSHNDTVSNASGGVYIAHAGDNQTNGNECVYINFKNICSSEEQVKNMMSEGIRKIRVDLYGNWFSSKGTGLLDVSLITYKGGDMTKDSANFNFINETGTITYDKKHSSKVCTQGNGRASNYNKGQDVGYTNIGYIEYDITNGNAILTLNAECADDNYVLSNNLPITSLTIEYSASTENSVMFTSTKNNNFFSGVSITSTQTWMKDFVTNSTSNPLIYTYTVEENTSSSERLGKIIITQNESGKLLEYQIKQQPNNATFFSLDYNEEKRELDYSLESTETQLSITVYSCKNYNSTNKTGNRLDYYIDTYGCTTVIERVEAEDYKYNHTFNVPIDCENGTIILRQTETNNIITISFSRTNSFELSVSQQTVEIDAPAVEAYITITSKKNGQPYSAIMFSESCEWVNSYNLQSERNGEYNYQFTTQSNSELTPRSCEITVSQNGGQSKTFTIKQNAAEVNCMTVSYILTDICENVNSIPIYFSTTNGTMQATHMLGTTNTTIELCNIAENTDLNVTTNSNDVTLSGDISFTYIKDANKTINVQGKCPPGEYYFSFEEYREKTNTSITFNYPDSDIFEVPIFSCYGTSYNNGVAAPYTYEMNPVILHQDMTKNGCKQGQAFIVKDSNGNLIANRGTIKFKQTNTNKELICEWVAEEKPVVTYIEIRNNCPGEVTIIHTDPHGVKQTIQLPATTSGTYNVPLSGSTDFEVSIPRSSYNNNRSNSIYVEFFDSNGNTIPGTPVGEFGYEGGGYMLYPNMDGLTATNNSVCTTGAKFQICGTIIFKIE